MCWAGTHIEGFVKKIDLDKSEILQKEDMISHSTITHFIALLIDIYKFMENGISENFDNVL